MKKKLLVLSAVGVLLVSAIVYGANYEVTITCRGGSCGKPRTFQRSANSASEAEDLVLSSYRHRYNQCAGRAYVSGSKEVK